MDSYLVSFRLSNPEDYDKVSDRLRNYPKWARIMDNVWIVLSDTKLTDVRDSISTVLSEGGGSVLAIKVNHAAWGTYSVDKDVTDWMRENI